MAESLTCLQIRGIAQGPREVMKTVPFKTHVSLPLLVWTFCLSSMTILMLLAILILSVRPSGRLSHRIALGRRHQFARAQ